MWVIKDGEAQSGTKRTNHARHQTPNAGPPSQGFIRRRESGKEDYQRLLHLKSVRGVGGNEKKIGDCTDRMGKKTCFQWLIGAYNGQRV